MTIDQCVSIISALIALAGLLFVAKQLRDANGQTKLGSQIKLLDINRDLISLGFSDPQLFTILSDAKNADPMMERRYLQLWLNQLALIHSFRVNKIFEKEVQESFERDLRDFMSMSNMRRHWRKFEKYYPASFQAYVNTIIAEAGPEQPFSEAVKK